MAIDQLKRSCTIVLHDDKVSTDDVLGGFGALPPGILAKLTAPGAIPLYVLAKATATSQDEVSVHISLAQRFGFENRASGTIQILEVAETSSATATHVEFLFRDQHLSRADMWRIMQRLDKTVVYRDQGVNYLGSPAAEIRAVYIAGKEVSSAYATVARTKPIFRSGSARYTILVQVSKEMLEYWIDGDLMYERVVSGYLPELFRKWDAMKVRHQVTVVLFGRPTATRDGEQAADFFHEVASDVPSSDWREILHRLKRVFNGSSLPGQVALAANGSLIEAIHMAAMNFANDSIDPRLGSRGTSIIAITAGAGLFETDHNMLKSTTQLLMGNSIGVDIVAFSPKPLHPVPLFGYQRDDVWEYALPHWVDISFWAGEKAGYTSSWLLPRAAGDVQNVCLPHMNADRPGLPSIAQSKMDGYDDALFGGMADATGTARPSVVPKLAPRATHAAPIAGSGTVSSTAKGHTAPMKGTTTASNTREADAALSTPTKRGQHPVLPPHSLMGSGRKISLGPKGLAPGRGLASITLSVAHAQHDREAVISPPFSPDEASSGIAKQIRQSLARKPSQQSLTSQPSAQSTVVTKPIDIQPGVLEADRDLASVAERNVKGATPTSFTAVAAAGVSDTPTAKSDLFYAAMKAAEDEGHWNTSPWLTLLNPCNPTRDNMRVAAQYRKWQHVFPRAVSPTEFKWASMCSPAALPLTTEYKPSARTLERHFTKKVRRLLIPASTDHGHRGGQHALAQLVKLRLSHGFQISATDSPQSGNEDSGRVLMSLGNVHHELQCLSDAELQVVEYALDKTDSSQIDDDIGRSYTLRIRSAVGSKSLTSTAKLTATRPRPNWARLDEQVITHDTSHTEGESTRMRLVLIPVELPRPGHLTPGPSRGLSDEERHIDGIQRLTQLWQRHRYVAPEDRRHQATLNRSKTTPIMTARDPNPLAIEYQTRDPSAIVNAYGPVLTGELDGTEQIAPLFAESELYHSSSFDVAKLVKQMQEPPPHGVEVRDRRWFARLHFKCFRGDEMVNWLLRVFKDLHTRDDAITIGKDLMARGIFSHVRARHEFRDGNYFYQIASAHRTTEYPDNASMFGRGSMRSVPSTPLAELRGSPMIRPLREEGLSSGKPTPTMPPAEKRQLLLSEQMLYNVDSAKKSDQLEIISLHYDRIHNPENCYHILLEWVNTTALLIREATSRWTTLAESHGLKLVQVPLAEASKLHLQHPFDQPIRVTLSLKPPERVPMTPIIDPQAFGPRLVEDPQAYLKALLRKMDFVLDIEAAASFRADLNVLYSYGRPDYDMTQFIHRSGLLLAQICGDGEYDFLLLPNRLVSARHSVASRVVDAEPVDNIVKRFIAFCEDETALKAVYDEANRRSLPPPSPSVADDFRLNDDIPTMQLPPRLAHRAVMRTDAQKNILNWVDPKDKTGEFKRQQSTFRDWISSEEGAEFPAEKDRYHLYVSYACPWAHRALIVRKLKGLEDIIPFTSVHWHMLEKGWRFATSDGEAPGENVTPDPIHPDFTHIRDVYFENNADYQGRFTVPTLYDKKQKRIVNNESSEIIRMFYHAFDAILPEKYAKLDLLPKELEAKIEATNEWTYNDINNGVYKSGFATTQEAYEKNVKTLFAALDKAEAELAASPGPYYHGEQVTEADVRLYTTIIRFDAVYVQHFKCNLRDIRSGYPALHKWVRYCYWKNAAFGETTEFTHIKNHYTKSHHQINPLSITPLGPDVNILPLDEEVAAVKAALKK
ncbi:vacuolar membrane-associated protein iml1 [Teratosphaeriaceae sp. CCFEE 6253]|nr:vacuolar membrane-associated protein iml1 [Teratosphaeriaceae sp. CCFEE 6253]